MKDYKDALRDWFLANAIIPSYYGGAVLPEEGETLAFWYHIEKCQMVWVREPNLGSVAAFDGTFAEGDRMVAGVTARLACSCDEYEAYLNDVTFFVPGERSLGQLIAEVIAAGEDGK